MPRAPRIDKPYFLQHITVKAAGEGNLFEDDPDRASFLHRLDLLLQQTRTACLAWALLPDRFHLLLRPSAESLSYFMRRLLTGYAMAFNRRHRRSGSLFQGRYRSTVCDEGNYLLELVRYIHLSPLRHGLLANVKGLDQYPWTGHAVLLGFQVLAGQSDREVLRRFGRKIENCRMRYRRFIRAAAAEGYRDEPAAGSFPRFTKPGVDEHPVRLDRRLLGSREFVEDLMTRYDLHTPQGAGWEPFSWGRSAQVVAVPITELVRRVAEIMEIDAGMISRPGRPAAVSTARSVISYLGYRKMGHGGEAVARALGITRSGVCRRALAGEEICRRDQRFEELLCPQGSDCLTT